MRRPRQKSRFWRVARLYFRRFRIVVWLIILLLLGGLVYLNQVGLPRLIKDPLLAKLRERGLDLQFSRLRLSFYGGIVAENVRIGQASASNAPSLTAAQAVVELRRGALARLQIQVDALTLRRGTLTWPVIETNGPARALILTNIHTDLRFLPRDQWMLDNFRAEFAGAHVRLTGAITNASAVRTWKIFQRSQPAGGGAAQRQVRAVADAIERTRFVAPPELVVEVRGDATNVSMFSALILLSTQGADTPWGEVADGKFTMRVTPHTNQTLSQASITLDAGAGRTRWASVTNVHLRIDGVSGTEQPLFSKAQVKLRADAAQTPWAAGVGLDLQARLALADGQTNIVEGHLEVAFEKAETKWANAGTSRITAQWLHSLTNSIPLRGRGTLLVSNGHSRWATVSGVSLDIEMHPASVASGAMAPQLAWWTNLAPYALGWRLSVDRLSSNTLVASSIELGGDWQMPWLHATNISALASTGRLAGAADLNVQTRRATAVARSDVDPARVMPLLTAGARRWLSQFTWNSAPSAQSRIALVLPEWTNRTPDWRNEVRPTLELDGEFDVRGGGSYRGVPVSSARSRFTYSNMWWHLPDLFVVRPEGTLVAEHRADDRTKAFSWRIRSTMDPREVGPLLGTNGHKLKDFFTFTTPPAVEGQVWGYSRQPERTAVLGRFAVTNFTFRGESFSGVQADVQLTNKVLRFLEPRGQRGEQRLTAEGVTADFNSQLVFITNAFCTAEVMPVARAIGAGAAKAMEPFRFGQPPMVHVNGVVPMRGQEGADLRFVVEGGPFHWQSFNIPQIAGNVRWQGMNLRLTDVRADLYGGKALGYAAFRFQRDGPGEYDFALTTTNTMLQPLMQDVFSATNQVEGVLNGGLVVTRGTTDDWHTWDGYGSAHLRDGLIWDIPVFGVFSPVLNGISPGLGNSRASSATFSFYMTNGVLHSSDMEIRSSGMRLQYRGTVDLNTRLNARVEAELLRDVWVLGPLISTVFWPVSKMFEYKVTGTLGDPQLEPLYVFPRLMTLPLQPFRILRGILPDPPGDNRTNGPARGP